MRVRTNRAVTTRAGIKENAPGLPISPERPPPELLSNPVLSTNHGKGALSSAKKQPPAITAPIVLLVPVIVELLLTQLYGLPVRQAGNRFLSIGQDAITLSYQDRVPILAQIVCLDFVHLGGVGEDVGELSVNCGWGFSAVGFQPRQCNISVGQPQHEVRRFRHVSNFCTKSSVPDR